MAHYFEEFWTKGNADVVDEVCSDDTVIYYPLHGRRVGKEAAKKMFTEFKVVSRHKGTKVHVPKIPRLADTLVRCK